VLKGPQVHKVNKEFQVPKVQQEKEEPMVLKDFEVKLAQLARKVFRESVDYQGFKEIRANKDYQDQPENGVRLD